jgi:hypothetical protein
VAGGGSSSAFSLLKSPKEKEQTCENQQAGLLYFLDADLGRRDECRAECRKPQDQPD